LNETDYLEAILMIMMIMMMKNHQVQKTRMVHKTMIIVMPKKETEITVHLMMKMDLNQVKTDQAKMMEKMDLVQTGESMMLTTDKMEMTMMEIRMVIL